jgi:hypothetical protein
LVRSTLAIYITLSAVAVVAIAQFLYFKLVLSRQQPASEDVADMGWMHEPINAGIGVGVDDIEEALEPERVPVTEPAFVAEPAFAAEPALLAA